MTFQPGAPMPGAMPGAVMGMKKRAKGKPVAKKAPVKTKQKTAPAGPAWAGVANQMLGQTPPGA